MARTKLVRGRRVPLTAAEEAEADAKKAAWDARAQDRADIKDDPRATEIEDALLDAAPQTPTIIAIKARRAKANAARGRSS